MYSSFYDNIDDATNGFGRMLTDQKLRSGIYIARQNRHQYIKIYDDWIILFNSNLDILIINGLLYGKELQIFMYLKSNMEFGNKITQTRIDIAKHFNIRPNNVSRSMKKLERLKIIIKIDKIWYVNPHICIRCNTYEPDENMRKLIEISTELIKDTEMTEKVKYIVKR